MTIDKAIESLEARATSKYVSKWLPNYRDALHLAIDALRAQKHPLPPPCYNPDGDGCSYQIYGDNDDEPIEKCKACPLCYSDKKRKKKSVLPMKHGFWVAIDAGLDAFDYYFQCSECGGKTPDGAFVVSPDYCPYCGTKMDLEY